MSGGTHGKSRRAVLSLSEASHVSRPCACEVKSSQSTPNHAITARSGAQHEIMANLIRLDFYICLISGNNPEGKY